MAQRANLYSRHHEVQPLEIRRNRIVEARQYNQVQIGLKTLQPQIRFQIPRLKHMDLILQKEAWIVVDRVLNDMPVLAWMHFQVSQRDNLHKPIHCEVYTWHFLAGMLMTRTLETLNAMMQAKLEDPYQHHTEPQILRFPGRPR